MSPPPRHTACVPVLVRYLGRLGALLDAVEAAEDAPGLLEARLAPDMLPFHLQVTVAGNFALRMAFPLAGRPAPPFGDEPATVAGLRQRLARVTGLVLALPADAFAADRTLQDRAGDTTVVLPADEFLHQYALPNFFFHVSAAYHILRHRGLPVGKATFDGFHAYG